MKSRKRDDLIERVKYGRMTPAEAEAEAARLGLIPLATSPDPLKHNPLGEAWWALPMVVAWIMWRDPKAVLDCFDPYRTQFWEWHYEEWRVGPDGPIQKGHFLKQRRRATLSQLRLSESYDASTDTLRESSHKVADATALLWKALQDNVLQATGIPNDDEERRPIPDYKWRDLELIEERGRDVVRYGSLSSRGYNDVVFPRDSIFTLWPELALQRQLELPPTIRPDGPGYFPLYSAAQWIATQGGIRDFDPTDSSIWMAAYSALTARIASDHVAITGARNGIREKIGGHIFASMRVDYPFADTSFDLILSDELYLCSYPYIDDEHWRGGLDDSLQTRAGTQWSKLMVLKSDIAQFWPFSPGDLIQVDGLEVAPHEIRRAEDIAPVFETLKSQADALYVAEDTLIFVNRTPIVTLALGARLPTIFGNRDFVQAGALMSYGPNYPALFLRTADFVDKILRGTKPGDIPVEQPTKFDLIINLKTAKALGLTVPDKIQALADEVIE